MGSGSVTTPAQSFQIISSLRYDPTLPEVVTHHAAESYPSPKNSPYYLLPYHRDRLLNAAKHFSWDQALVFLQQDLKQFSRILDTHIPDGSKPWRLRIAIDCNGGCTVEVHPTAPCSPLNLLVPSGSSSQSDIWRVYVDVQPTTASAFTAHKTTARDDYTAARQRAGINSPLDLAEVLVVNPEGEIMEGSITTPYLLRRASESGAPRWVTPPLSSGGNAGTTRRYALAQGFCVEQVVKASELVDGEECWLSNGVRGFMRGVIVLERRCEQYLDIGVPPEQQRYLCA